jgi:hypothetical protein
VPTPCRAYPDSRGLTTIAVTAVLQNWGSFHVHATGAGGGTEPPAAAAATRRVGPFTLITALDASHNRIPVPERRHIARSVDGEYTVLLSRPLTGSDPRLFMAEADTSRYLLGPFAMPATALSGPGEPKRTPGVVGRAGNPASTSNNARTGALPIRRRRSRNAFADGQTTGIPDRPAVSLSQPRRWPTSGNRHIASKK